MQCLWVVLRSKLDAPGLVALLKHLLTMGQAAGYWIVARHNFWPHASRATTKLKQHIQHFSRFTFQDCFHIAGKGIQLKEGGFLRSGFKRRFVGECAHTALPYPSQPIERCELLGWNATGAHSAIEQQSAPAIWKGIVEHAKKPIKHTRSGRNHALPQGQLFR